MDDEHIEERKKKVKQFFLEKNLWIYIALIVILILGIWIRTLPMSDHGGQPGLRDITTNSWTLGPDLDPFLFLRNAREIVETGSLPINDALRNAPLGFNTLTETRLLPYMIVWTYEFLHSFSSGVGVDYAAVVFPVIMFALTVVIFFLFVLELFSRKGEKSKKPGIIAVIATLFMTVIPVFLPRTIAGIPEKESAGFFFMFLSLYLFLKAWKSGKIKYSAVFALLSGISTAAMGLVWGGVVYVYVTIAVACLIAFVLNKVRKKEAISYAIWIISSLIVTFTFTERGSLKGFITSLDTGLAFLVLFIFFVHFLLWKTKLKDTRISRIKIPRNITSIIFAIVLLVIIVSVAFGPNFIINKIKDLNQILFKPVTGRWNTTVAENRQPFFTEWGRDFGPFFDFIKSGIFIKVIPLLFLLIVFGSIFLFREMLKVIKRNDRLMLVCLYVLFFFGLVFSRYDSSFSGGASGQLYSLVMLISLGLIGFLGYSFFKKSKEHKNIFNYIMSGILSVLFIFVFLALVAPGNANFFMNGENFISRFFYYISALLLVGSLVYYYFNYRKNGDSSFEKIDYEYLLLFSLFILSLFTARSAVRLIMVLGPIAPIFASWLAVEAVSKAMKRKGDDWKSVSIKVLAGIIVILTIFSLFGIPGTSFTGFTQNVKNQAYNSVPYYYTFQWQKAMSWVRNSTPENSVFEHWWDYGYWVQSMGNRATVTDGGNAITYWNYLTGRLVLTGDNQKDALEFSYSHNVTHLLIDSSDISKYGAFAQIGSDANLDRFSAGPVTFLSSQPEEKKNGLERVYTISAGNGRVGIAGIEEDIVININGTRQNILKENSGIIGIIVDYNEVNSTVNFEQPQAVFISNGKQLSIPMRYMYHNGKIFDFGSGINATAYPIPAVASSVDPLGAVIYISPRVMRGLLAQVYILNNALGNFPNFRLVHSEDSLIVESIRSQGYPLNEFAYFPYAGGIQGPIKIWSIEYTGNEKVNPAYLDTDYSKYISWKL